VEGDSHQLEDFELKMLLGTQQRIPDDLLVYSSGSWSHYEGLTWCYVVDTIGSCVSFDLYLWNTATERKTNLASFDDTDSTLLACILDVDGDAPELLANDIMHRRLANTDRPPAHVSEEMFARLVAWISYWRGKGQCQ
jgi:hypothetical protein